MTTAAAALVPLPLAPSSVDLDGLLRRLALPTIRRLYPELQTRAEADALSYRDFLALLGTYLGPELVTEGRSLILAGKPGTGKTHLAVAIAYRAIQNGFDARFTTAADLLDRLARASRDGRLADAITDRILERGRLIELRGPSYRTRHLKPAADSKPVQNP